MAFVTDSNRPQPLWQPPPTACLTASEVPSLLRIPALMLSSVLAVGAARAGPKRRCQTFFRRRLSAPFHSQRGRCGHVVPISYGAVWPFGPYLLWCCVAAWSPSLMVLCGCLVPISYGAVWLFGPHLLWCCVAVWSLSLMVLCGRLVPISYGAVWPLGPYFLWCCVAVWSLFLVVLCGRPTHCQPQASPCSASPQLNRIPLTPPTHLPLIAAPGGRPGWAVPRHHRGLGARRQRIPL